MTSKEFYFYLKIVLIVFLVKLSKQTTFIDPINPIYSPGDRVITDSDTNDKYKYIWFKYVLSSSGTNYYDRRNGEVYEGKPLCYQESSTSSYATITPIWSTSSLTFLTGTNLLNYWTQTCYPGSSDNMYIPLYFHCDSSCTSSSNYQYNLVFNLFNPSTTTTAKFSILIRDFTTPSPNQFDITGQISIPPQTKLSYLIKFNTGFTYNAVNFWLPADGYSSPVSTPVNPASFSFPFPSHWVWFDNSKTLPTSPAPVNFPFQPPYSTPNMKLYIIYYGNRIDLAGITFYSLNTSTSTTNNLSLSQGNNCSDSRKCRYGCGCNSSNSCFSCNDKQCKYCDSTNGTDLCTHCWRTSSKWSLGYLSTAGKCPFDFLDMKNINDITLNVPPAHHYRVTLDFWIFVNDPTNLLNSASAPSSSNIIYKDFLSISILQGSPTSSIDIYCIPIEFIFTVKGTTTSSAFKSLILTFTNQATILKDTISSAANIWSYVRCAFSYDHIQAYINQKPLTTLLTPYMYVGQSNFNTFFKKFYKSGATVNFIMEGFTNLKTSIYIRNINVYREFIPQTMDLKYYNIHTISDINIFPQLLFSFPLDDVQVSGTAVSAILYDYSSNTQTTLTKTTISTITAIAQTSQNFNPPVEFYRMNWLPLNKYFSSIELDQYISISCPTSSNMMYCFADNKPFVCQSGYYLDIITYTCNQYCPTGYIRPIDEISFNDRDWCNLPCDSNSLVCPNSPLTYKNIKDNFSCSNNYITYYYKCISSNDPKISNTALQFSSVINTNSIDINLNTSYSSFIIDVWIYTDLFFSPTTIPTNSVIFLTNNHKIVYGSPPKLNVNWSAGAFTDTINFNTNDSFSRYNWNHLIFANILQGTNTYYYASFRNQLYPDATQPLANKAYTTPLTNIYFCNNDNSISKCSGTWIDAYYKSLRIWDGNWTNIWAINQVNNYINDVNISLLHYFPMTLNYLTGNKIQDSKNPSIYGTVANSVTNTWNSPRNPNPDNTNMFNIVNDFDWWQSNNLSKTMMNIGGSKIAGLSGASSSTCPTGCTICSYAASGSDCLSCNSSYGLIGNKCLNHPTGSLFYKNPPSNASGDISLNISSLNIQSQPGITLMFFVKIYSFSSKTSPASIITFDSINNFALKYDSNLKTVTFTFQNVKDFFYNVGTGNDFKNDFFGKWVPYSISMFRSADTTTFPVMTSATIYYQLLARNNQIFNSYEIREITFSRNFIGLISNFQILNSFTINPWGLGKDLKNYSTYLYYTFPLTTLVSSNINSCINDSQLLNTNVSQISPVCVPDYNVHLDTSACTGFTPITNQYIDFVTNDTPKCGGGCLCDNKPYLTGSNTAVCITPLPTDPGVCNSNQGLPIWACEHKFTKKEMLFWYLDDNTNQIICGPTLFINFNRYSATTYTSIVSPQSAFNIDFWFYTQSYVTSSGSNFGSLEISWDRHAKILIKNVSNTFTVYCYPVIDINNSSNDPLPKNISLNGTINNRWIFISCGIDPSVNNFFLTTTPFSTNTSSYSSLNIIPSSSVVLKINESSRDNYGVTHIYSLRLWGCYICNSSAIYLPYQSSYTLFSNLLMNLSGKYYLDPLSNGPQLLNDINSSTISPAMSEKTNWVGNGVLFYTSGPLSCDEYTHLFFNTYTSSCKKIINFNRLDNFVFPSIPSSRTNRWTMEGWIYVEVVQQIEVGINIVWNQHLGISVIRDQTSLTTLDIVCFPQGYRDDITGKKGSEIFNLYSNAINKGMSQEILASSKWVFFRCAVNLHSGLFYVSNKPIQTIINEIMYGNVRNSIPYRFFNMPLTTDVNFYNMKLNNSRIFMRQFQVYNDFIPQSLINTKYRDMSKFAILSYTPLVLFVDFDAYEWSNLAPIPRRLPYTVIDHDSNTLSTLYLINFLSNLGPINYTTYPSFNILNLCDIDYKGDGNNNCVKISNVSTDCQTASLFCYDKVNNQLQYFWCPANKFLDMSNLSCNSNCPTGYTRLPDSSDQTAYCLKSCSSGNFNACPNTAANIVLSNYKLNSNFNCIQNYSLIFYNCILNSSLQNSAIYMNNLFSTSNMISDLSSQNINNYYIEFWFMFDNFNTVISSNNLDFFFAPPHKIFKDINDGKYKYANMNINNWGTYYLLPSINQYEWNRIIISVYSNTITGFWNINLYVNYFFSASEISLPNNILTSVNMNLRGILFCNKPISNCQLGGTTYTPEWGNAWYRNIRIWDYTTSSLQMIQSYERIFSDYTTSMLHNYKFTADTIVQLAPGTNIKIFDNYNNNPTHFSIKYNWNSDYDNDIRVNYSVDFDFGANQLNSYISQKTSSGYLTSICDSRCSRCYSISSSECYECNTGFVLIGKSCIVATNYYLKTPSTVTTNNISLVDSFVNSSISNLNPITISFWIKYFGLISPLPVGAFTYYPIFYFYSTTSFFGYDNNNKRFVLVIDSLLAFTSLSITNYIGVWTMIGISVYRSANSLIFPNMFNFMIQTSVLIPLPGFNVYTTQVMIDNLTFSQLTSSLFSSLSIHNNYIHGPYGIIMGNNILGNYLIKSYSLSGSLSSNCISNTDLKNVTPGSLGINCAPDYMAYQISSLSCKNNALYFDLSIKNSIIPCGSCHDSCNIACYGNDYTQCSCYFNILDSWITTQIPVTNYYCTAIKSINFSFYNPLSISPVSVSPNQEYTIEFWAYIYSYTGGQFTSLDIIWDKHIRVTIINVGNIKSRCYPYVDKSNTIIYNYYTEDSIFEKNWFYIKCAVNRIKKLYMTQSNIETNIINALPAWPSPFKTTSLYISDNVNNSNLNYGFSFIRELKLISSYNFFQLNYGYNILNPTNYPSLLHYFRNLYSSRDKIIDYVTNIAYDLTKLNNIIGYNYVINFQELVVCDEGSILSGSYTCQPMSTTKCQYSSNINDDCILCPKIKPYLYYNSTSSYCYSKCPDSFYGDTFTLQCRKCDTTCFQCNNQFYNNCTACNGTNYLVPSLSICVPNCLIYNLTPSSNIPNLCVPFQANASITNYNITEHLNPNTLNYLVAKVYNNTGNNLSTIWRFSQNETDIMNINNSYKVPGNNPFRSDTSNLGVSLDPSFFTNGNKYLFYLDITNNFQFAQVTVSQQFIITTNYVPYNGTLYILPKIGFTVQTNFLLSCQKFVDDNTIDFQYKFTYLDQYSTEQSLTDWRSYFEYTTQFIAPTTQPNITYLVRCYAKDKYGATNYTISNVTIINPLISNYSIQSLINNTDFDSNLTILQIFDRVNTISSVTQDIYKSIKIQNKTLISIGNDNINLDLRDPICSELYCNNRGECNLIDKYLSCSCDSSYLGDNCQIDLSSYEYLKGIYKKLLNLSTIYLSDNMTATFALKSLDILFNSGAHFIDESDFLFNALDFIKLVQQKYPSILIFNIKIFFGYFDAMINNCLMKINKMKSENSNYNLTLRNSTLTYSQYNYFQDIMKNIMTGLDGLITFYAQNYIDFNTSISYDSNNLHILLYGVDQNFNFTTIQNLYQPLYMPYFEMNDCFSIIMSKKYSKSSFQIWMNYNIWKTNPFIYSQSLYENNTSPYIEINFIDIKTGQKYEFDDCKNHEIKQYFPVTNNYIVPFINNKRSMLDPSKQYPVNSTIFSMPLYIAPNGEVKNETIKQRIDKYFIDFNFTCKFFNTSTLKFEERGMTYYNFSNNYYICKSTHLTGFLVDILQIIPNFNILGRFYYVPHYELFFWGGNYSNNFGLYLMLIILCIYLSFAIIYSFCDSWVYERLGLLDYLKKQIIMVNLPYSRSYNYNLNNLINSEAITRINKGTNNVNSEKIKKEPEDVRLYDIHNNSEDHNIHNTIVLEEFKAPDYDVIILNDNNFLDKEMKKYSIMPFPLSNRTNKSNSNPINTNEKDELFKAQIQKNEKVENLKQPKTEYKLSHFEMEEKKDAEVDEDNNLKILNIKNLKPILRKVEEEVHTDKIILNDINDLKSKEKDKEINLKFNSEKSNNIKKIFEEKDGIKRDNFILKKNKNHKIMKNQISNFENEEEKESNNLPELDEEFDENSRIVEFANIDLTFWEFFKRNIKVRHTILSLILNISITYGRFKKIGNFCTLLSLKILINVIFLTIESDLNIVYNNLKKDTVYDKYIIGKFFLYSTCTIMIANISIYFLSYLFYIPRTKFRHLYKIVKKEPGLKILAEWEIIKNSNSKYFDAYGFFFQGIVFLASLYMSFTFCAVYSNQALTLLITFIFVLCYDYFILEVITELIIALFYLGRHNGGIFLNLAESINHSRTIKTLT